MKAFQEIEVELTRLRLLEPQLLKRITELERENKTIEQLQIEAEHWKQAYYEERAKYLNLINNK